MWIVSLLRAVVRGGLQEKNKVHVILDEAASWATWTSSTMLSTSTVDTACDCFSCSSPTARSRRSAPTARNRHFLSNVTQIFAGVNDNETAKYVSERLGKSTIIIESGGTGTSNQTSSQQGQGGGSATHSSGRSSNDNWQQSGRELLQPSEVMNLDPRIAIVFTPGIRPLWATMVRYYEAAFQKQAALVLGCGRTFSPGGGHPAFRRGMCRLPHDGSQPAVPDRGDSRSDPYLLATQVMAVPGLIPAERSALCGMSSSFLKVRVAAEIGGSVLRVGRYSVVGTCDAESYAPRSVANPGRGGSPTENIARGPCEGETRVERNRKTV